MVYRMPIFMTTETVAANSPVPFSKKFTTKTALTAKTKTEAVLAHPAPVSTPSGLGVFVPACTSQAGYFIFLITHATFPALCGTRTFSVILLICRVVFGHMSVN